MLNESQLIDLKHYQSVADITEEEFLSWGRNAHLYSWVITSPNGIEKKIEINRAILYREETLEKFDSESGNPRGWRCYSEGIDKYRRKDGKPLNEMDVECIQLLSHGQGFSIEVAEDRSYLTYKWFVDSSD